MVNFIKENNTNCLVVKFGFKMITLNQGELTLQFKCVIHLKCHLIYLSFHFTSGGHRPLQHAASQADPRLSGHQAEELGGDHR